MWRALLGFSAVDAFALGMRRALMMRSIMKNLMH